MSSLFKFTAIALGVLVFAFVLTICGDAFACTDGFDACCMRSDKPAGMHLIVQRLMQACSRFGLLPGQLLASGSGSALDLASCETVIPSTLLTSKVAQLRI